MDLADLQLIEAVAVHGSFSAAAVQLRLSQPSVSARIAGAERVIGATLFVRDSRGARLTAAGDRYLAYLRRSLALLADGQRAAAAEPEPATLRVGVPSSYAAALAPTLADAATVCAVSLNLRAAHSRNLRDELLDGRLDVALVTAGPVPVGLTNTPALTTHTAAVAAPGSTSESSDVRYAVHNWSESSDDVISHLLGRGVAAVAIAVVSPAAAAISLALHRGYVAVVPRLAAEIEIVDGRLRTLDLPLPHRSVRLDWLHRLNPPQPTHRFINRVDTTARPPPSFSRHR